MKTERRLVLPQAPSPIMTSFLLVARAGSALVAVMCYHKKALGGLPSDDGVVILCHCERSAVPKAPPTCLGALNGCVETVTFSGFVLRSLRDAYMMSSGILAFDCFCWDLSSTFCQDRVSDGYTRPMLGVQRDVKR